MMSRMAQAACSSPSQSRASAFRRNGPATDQPKFRMLDERQEPTCGSLAAISIDGVINSVLLPSWRLMLCPDVEKLIIPEQRVLPISRKSWSDIDQALADICYIGRLLIVPRSWSDIVLC